MSASDNRPLFKSPAGQPARQPTESSSGSDPQPWKVMIVDDDSSTHEVTDLVLEDFRFEGRRLKVINGYSGAQACELMKRHPDTAVLLLDVVMESDHAGLEAVKYIREQLKNRFVRIILRTGQPGQAPESRVISQYDINDYKDKSDLTALKLNTAMIVALRSYQDLKRIQKLSMSNDTLEQLVKERTAELQNSNRQLHSEVSKRSESEARLAEAQRIARIGNWTWQPEQSRMTWSDQIFHIFQLDPADNPADYQRFIELIHPEDRELIETLHQRVIEQKQPHFNIEHRIISGQGQLRYVNQQAELEYDDSGKLHHIVGIVQDITERHAAETEMRKLSLVVEQIADSIMITDNQGTIEYVNPAFEQTTGYGKQDVIGRNPRLLKSDQQSESFYQRMWKTILSGQVFSEVIINKRKDGSLYYEEKTITPQKDRQGEITHFISTGKDITERMEVQQRFQHMAHHDALTGLPNRLLLQDRLHQAMPRTLWHKRGLGIMFLDLDRFKRINDTLGHDVGDQLLREVAARFSTCVREGDTVARLGGDEFAILLNDLSSREDVAPVADKLVESLAEPIMVNDLELYVAVSIGISLFPEDGKDNKTLLKKADIAMYQAKANGGNSYFFYADEGNVDAAERLALEAKLRRALERGEFHLHYQPQLKLDTAEIVSREVLLRWSHPEFTNVTPDRFIPLLEETGLIVAVGEWVLHTACLDEMVRQQAGLKPQRVAVNLSIRQFRDSGFVAMVEQVIQQTGIDPQYLELEVTESLLIDNISATAKVLHQLHDLGVKLSIDDFGTGYSSMNYLKRLPFDTLKIDQSFVRDIIRNRDDAAIAVAIITLAHSMDLEVVAEGVETLEQLEYLQGQGCDLIQGYLCSRPIPFDELTAFDEIDPQLKSFLQPGTPTPEAES